MHASALYGNRQNQHFNPFRLDIFELYIYYKTNRNYDNNVLPAIDYRHVDAFLISHVGEITHFWTIYQVGKAFKKVSINLHGHK